MLSQLSTIFVKTCLILSLFLCGGIAEKIVRSAERDATDERGTIRPCSPEQKELIQAAAIRMQLSVPSSAYPRRHCRSVPYSVSGICTEADVVGQTGVYFVDFDKHVPHGDSEFSCTVHKLSGGIPEKTQGSINPNETFLRCCQNPSPPPRAAPAVPAGGAAGSAAGAADRSEPAIQITCPGNLTTGSIYGYQSELTPIVGNLRAPVRDSHGVIIKDTSPLVGESNPKTRYDLHVGIICETPTGDHQTTVLCPNHYNPDNPEGARLVEIYYRQINQNGTRLRLPMGKVLEDHTQNMGWCCPVRIPIAIMQEDGTMICTEPSTAYPPQPHRRNSRDTYFPEPPAAPPGAPPASAQ